VEIGTSEAVLPVADRQVRAASELSIVGVTFFFVGRAIDAVSGVHTSCSAFFTISSVPFSSQLIRVRDSFVQLVLMCFE